jgi:hypothetical protein
VVDGGGTVTQRPIYLTKDEFLSLLDDVRRHVEADDSYEGHLEYTFPWSAEVGDPETDPPGPGFRVRAGYRVGNLMGQGGFVMVGKVE